MDNNHPQVISLRTAETIDREAADWLAQLDGGTLSADDRRRLKSWLSQDPRHARVLKSLASIWSDMDILLNEFPDTGSAETAGMFSLTGWKNCIWPALCAGLIAVSVWMFVPETTVSENSFYATSVGKQSIELFTDGSSVHLNTDSVIETEFTDSSRVVRLLRGEAMFDVAHEPQRPFVVYVNNRKVKAVGTKFVVRLTSENIVVTVTDGQVQLSKNDSGGLDDAIEQKREVILISKGEEAQVNDSIAQPTLKEIKDEELSQRLSWLSGQLVFKNERLEKVIKEINRYVPARIIIDDPQLRDVLISGRFKIGDTDALLEAIEVSLNVHASRIGEEIIHLYR